MYSGDTSDFTLPEDDSRLLSESLYLPSSSANSSRTGPGGDDLSLSELSLADRPPPGGPIHRRPFSLLAPPPEDDSAVDDEDLPEGESLDATMTPEDIENARRAAAKTREEKLQHDLYILKKLNAAFEVYKGALSETKSSTERVAEQLTHTNALLDKYMNILAKSEKVTKLMLDERWEGAEADEETLEIEYLKEKERLKREEEEREIAAQLERERVEREERERVAREEQRKLELERAEAAKTVSRGSGVRGVRGTRASMRGARGTARGGTTTRGQSATASGSSSTVNRSRPGSVASTRGSSSAPRGSGIPRKV